MASKVKTWVWVVAGIVGVGILCLIAIAAAGLWFAKTHVNVTSASRATVSQEFEQVRSRFATQKPLIEIDDRGRYVHANTDRPAAGPRPESLNILAFDPRNDRVVKMDVPFWLLRLKMRGTRISLGGSSMDLNDLNITVEDLERWGPTLIVDHTGSDGARVLVWSQ
jgi:hypothetical protein